MEGDHGLGFSCFHRKARKQQDVRFGDAQLLDHSALRLKSTINYHKILILIQFTLNRRLFLSKAILTLVPWNMPGEL